MKQGTSHAAAAVLLNANGDMVDAGAIAWTADGHQTVYHGYGQPVGHYNLSTFYVLARPAPSPN